MKKKYTKPTTEIIKLRIEQFVLTTSGDAPPVGVFIDDPIDIIHAL